MYTHLIGRFGYLNNLLNCIPIYIYGYKSNQSDIQLSHVGPIYGLIHGETFELIRRI